ncbi:hypothetical protein L596_018493 [Steinernema carpocapsae]|uniref:Rhodanese domain-containing protein n=1 Tax=Steinernema carpocapsae TaxID=34508 RepID=A0A4U5N555_STECR|nr:hypothetical protein L596_018493 [Steinernema carpocapsae]
MTKEDVTKEVGESMKGTIYVVCRRGNDSQRAVADLRQAFKGKNVKFTDFIGGYTPLGLLKRTRVFRFINCLGIPGVLLFPDLVNCYSFNSSCDSGDLFQFPM